MASSERPRNDLTAGNLLLLCACLGLLTGWAEAIRDWFWYRYLASSLFHNVHAIWMTPLAECFVFVIVGGMLWGLTCWLTRPRRIAVVAGGLAILSALSLTWGYLYLWAILMLGLGLAACLVRALSESCERLLHGARWTTPLLLLLAAAAAIWHLAAQKDQGPIASVAPPRDAPNVLLVVWDTVRADYVDWQPGNAHTPHLAELGARGTVFDRAIAPASWTLPTHASLFTGRYPDQLSSNWHSPLDGAGVTLSECYRQVGYETAGFVGNLYYCTRESGLDRGFQLYRDYQLSFDELIRHAFLVDWVARTKVGWSSLGIFDELGRKDGVQVTDEFMTWRRAASDRPFFAFLNYFDAHDPYLPAQLPDGSRLTNDQKRLLRVWRYRQPQSIRDDDIQLAQACYSAQIRQLDTFLGEVIDFLKSTGQYERTLIVVTGDHGEQFGEHGLYSHGNSVYRSVVHVPLVVSWPGKVPQGLRVEHPVTLCDVGQTLLQLSGGPGNSGFPGVSLANVWSQNPETPTVRPALATVDPHPRLDIFPHMCHSPANKGKQYALLTDNSYAVALGDRSWQLYDFAGDPREQIDLASPGHDSAPLLAVQERFAELLQATLGSDLSLDTVTWMTSQRDAEGRPADDPVADSRVD